MDYEGSYDKGRRWEENDQEEFEEEELRRIEKTMNDNDGDEMNVDKAK